MGDNMNYLRILKIGNTGEDVKILQEKLNILDYINEVTGSFGNSTYNAVINFQKDNNIESNGIVDSITWNELYNQTSIATISLYDTLKFGDKGNNVGELQKKLKSLLYYGNDINEIFDKTTLTAVKSFQYNNKITTDGIVGNNTWFLINAYYSVQEDCKKVNYEYYIVKPGDTLYSIANKNNISVEELKSLNNKNDNIINVGEKLKIYPNINQYIVKAGDTLYSIAKKLNISIQELKKINNLISDNIVIGQILKLNQALGDYYIVKENDTLYSIANNFKTTLEELIKLNNLENNLIITGQKLLIPTIQYKVKLGDTLFKIAKEYNTTVENIMKKNNLTTNIISLNQILTI